MKKLLLLFLLLFASLSACKSIKKNKSSASNDQNIKTEQIDESVENSQKVEEDKSESESVQEVVEETITRHEMIINPVTNEIVLSPIVTTRVKRKSSEKESLNVTKTELVNNSNASSYNQDLKTKSDSALFTKDVEGQEVGEIVGTVSKFALEGIFRGLFGNAIKMFVWIIIVILLIIVFLKRKKKPLT